MYADVASERPWITFAAFLVWLLAVGALGAMVLILVNALGIQADPTIDLTDRNATWFRILLGTLFSVILSLPFSCPSFAQIIQSGVPALNALLLIPIFVRL
jgi:hypothetical protein